MTARVLEKKRPGPVPRLGPMACCTLYVQRDLIDWAKHQPEGMSALVRRLLTEEQARRSPLSRTA